MLFKKIIRKALENVSKDYWGYGNADLNALSEKYPITSKELRPFVSQFEERVFCYELYHQMRILLAGEKSLSSKVFLHGEIGKNNLERHLELADLLGIQSLGQRFVPDFVFHDPYS